MTDRPHRPTIGLGWWTHLARKEMTWPTLHWARHTLPSRPLRQLALGVGCSKVGGVATIRAGPCDTTGCGARNGCTLTGVVHLVSSHLPMYPGVTQSGPLARAAEHRLLALPLQRHGTKSTLYTCRVKPAYMPHGPRGLEPRGNQPRASCQG